MPESQVTVIARIKAKPGMESRVKLELTMLLEPTRAEDGCINFDMHESLEDASQFMFHENWTSEAHLRRHFETQHISSWVALTAELCAEPLDVTTWKRTG